MTFPNRSGSTLYVAFATAFCATSVAFAGPQSLEGKVALATYEHQKSTYDVKVSCPGTDGKINVAVRLAAFKEGFTPRGGIFAAANLTCDRGNSGGVVQLYWVPTKGEPVHLAAVTAGSEDRMQQESEDSAAWTTVFSHTAATAEPGVDSRTENTYELSSRGIERFASALSAEDNSGKAKKKVRVLPVSHVVEGRVVYCKIKSDKIEEPCKP